MTMPGRLCRFSASPWRLFFFFNDTATTEIYTLSLHDALPISELRPIYHLLQPLRSLASGWRLEPRSEEHTSELQSRQYLVCRLLLEKKESEWNFYFGQTDTHTRDESVHSHMRYPSGGHHASLL